MVSKCCIPVVVLLFTLLGATTADYTCLCSYLVETNIYANPDKSSPVIGYMYEFDCKPVYPVNNPDPGFESIGNEHQLGFVEKNSQIQVQTCQGDIPLMDRVTTTMAPATTTTQATRPPKTTHEHTTHEHTTKDHTKHHTTQVVSTTAVPTVTTQGPTQTTTIPTTRTTSPLPTTRTTTPVPTTRTTTPLPTTRTTTPIPTTRTTTPIPTTRPTTPVPTTGTYSGCPQNMDPNNSLRSSNYCYELIRQANTWNGANNTCTKRGGTLVTIESAQQQAFVYSMLGKVGFYDPIWIGLSDQAGEEQWEWVTGTKLSYDNWMHGRLIDQYHDDEDCAVFVYMRNGEWDDTACQGYMFDAYLSYQYICQYRITFG